MAIEFYLILICSIISLLYGAFACKTILSAPEGSDKMKDIAKAIQEGAQAYLNRQYGTIAVVGLIIAIALFYGINSFVSIGFIIGAVLSGLAGYIGMFVSVRANVRTAEASKSGIQPALDISFNRRSMMRTFRLQVPFNLALLLLLYSSMLVVGFVLLILCIIIIYQQ